MHRDGASVEIPGGTSRSDSRHLRLHAVNTWSDFHEKPAGVKNASQVDSLSSARFLSSLFGREQPRPWPRFHSHSVGSPRRDPEHVGVRSGEALAADRPWGRHRVWFHSVRPNLPAQSPQQGPIAGDPSSDRRAENVAGGSDQEPTHIIFSGFGNAELGESVPESACRGCRPHLGAHRAALREGPRSDQRPMEFALPTDHADTSDQARP